MQSTKHAWQKPELTVLVRNRPEEMVLAVCKNPPKQSTGPEAKNCQQNSEPACFTAASS